MRRRSSELVADEVLSPRVLELQRIFLPLRPPFHLRTLPNRRPDAEDVQILEFRDLIRRLCSFVMLNRIDMQPEGSARG